MGKLVAIAAAAEIAETAAKVATKLRDNMPARGVVVEVHNHTDDELVMTGHEHTSGMFGELPSSRIPPKTVDIYGSRRRGRPEGAAGSVTYRVEGRDARVTVGWRLRWRSWRSRSSSSSVSGREAHLFAVSDIIGGSTSSGEARYEVTKRNGEIIVEGRPGTDAGSAGGGIGGGTGGIGRPGGGPLRPR
ncbi:hypothetical protein [Trujillonella humicola]|uniref:hypothetical protein n=1 Tax=Trujillonella humicola TaxID=3383699 RepID=UPI003906B4D6